MLFFLGLVLTILGFAMVVGGAFAWPGRQRMPAKAARIAGAIFLAFFPLYFAAWAALKRFEVDEFEAAIGYWCLAGLCLMAGVVVLLRGAVPVAARAVGLGGNPFAATAVEDESMEAAPAKPAVRPAAKPAAPAPAEDATWTALPPPKAAKKSKPVEKNPFDFS